MNISPVPSTLTVSGVNGEDVAASGAPVLTAGVVRSAIAPSTLVAGDVARLSMTTAAGLVVMPYSIPEVTWSYAAAASGIVNTTTAVTVKAAAGTGIRNYIKNIQIMAEALGTATEFAVRDGAAGTVLFRTKITTAGVNINLTFDTPLRGTANTLLEVVTLTASGTGAVYVNVQGYTGY